MAAHGRGLVLSPVLCTVFFLILPPKTNNVWLHRSRIHGFMVCISTTLPSLEMSKRLDENLTETTKVLAIRNMLKLFHSLISLVGCVGNVLGPHTDNIWQSKTKRECLRSIHFRIQNVYIQMLAKHSYVSSLNKIRLVFQAKALFVSALGKPTCKGLPGNRCKTFMGGLLDPWWYFGIWWCHFRRLQQHQFRGHETWVVFGDKICQAFSGNVREASPACTHPFNSKWEAEFNALARCFGGWSAGQSRHTQPTRGWPNESSKYGHCGMQMLLGVRYSWCLSITTTPNTIHLSAQPHHSMLILILPGLAGNDLFQQTWKIIHDLASALRQGCQITNFTKFKINSIHLGSALLRKYRLVVLHQHVINFQQRHFGGKTQNISAKILVLWEVFCWAKSCKETKAPPLFEDSQMQSIEHVGTLEFQNHLSTPWYETLLSANHFGRVPSWWTGENPLWAGQNNCEMVRKRENEKSHIEQLQNQLVFQIKQTGSSWWKNVGQNLSQLKQYWSK